MPYTPTIGLEIHAEVSTESKMFCGCKNDPHNAEPNTHICPVCLGYPGAMPFANEQAIERVLLLGAALDGALADYTRFDRKHYFYPDIPKGYQITQHTHPFIKNAKLLDVEVTHAHLEEDTARSSHDKATNTVLLDFNRAGVPLLELVTAPVIHSADDASRFARELQRVLQVTGVSRARMEQGEMRVEANISVSDTDELGTKVEVKNLNSFKSVRGAIEHEIQRQTQLLEKGEKVEQQTRGFDEARGTTFAQRSKETAQEYRYAPEPDLPPLRVSLNPKWSKEALTKRLPELPETTRARYRSEWSLLDEQIETILANAQRVRLFEETAKKIPKETVPLAANYLTSDIASHEETAGEALYTHLTPEAFAQLLMLIAENKLSSRGAKNTLAILVKDGGDPADIAEKQGLFQQSDTGALTELVKEAIAKNPSAVDDYKKGKESAVQFFVGQVMKATKGAADPQETGRIVQEVLAGE